MNLEEVGEHSYCGPPLDKSGFSYDPKVFMDNNSSTLQFAFSRENNEFNLVYFYNFTWKDYGSVSVRSLLDMVKVIAFALLQGKVGRFYRLAVN